MNKEKFIRIHEMASIGTIEGDCTVRVYGMESESRVPHFHITQGPESRPTKECCIKIKECGYYDHDSAKTHHRRVRDLSLSSERLQSLVTMLQEPVEDNLTKWQMLILNWNMQNPGDYRKVNSKMEMPDYTKLSK